MDVSQERARVLSGNTGDNITIRDLHKIYPGIAGTKPTVAVKSLTMGIRHGECVGMLGPNGAGKTTTINMLCGFAEPTSGTATIGGLDICDQMDSIYTVMGVCPQDNILWDILTAEEHLYFYGRLKNLRGEELKKAVEKALRSVNLWDDVVRKKLTMQFSGGMKRRLSVAIALIGNPLVVYLDEPSTGLDPASRRQLWSAIKEAKKDRSIILTTHSMEEAEALCDRIGIFVAGELRCIGGPKEITKTHGGHYVISATCSAGMQQRVHDFFKSVSGNAQCTYAVAETMKFSIPLEDIKISELFGKLQAQANAIGLTDWGISNASLEEVFISIAGPERIENVQWRNAAPNSSREAAGAAAPTMVVA